MDTLEIKATARNGRIPEFDPPMIWKGKTMREVQREKYPDHVYTEAPTPPKSLRTDIEYCKRAEILPYHPEKPRAMKDGEVFATLIEVNS